jgi:hypothetical protein
MIRLELWVLGEDRGKVPFYCIILKTLKHGIALRLTLVIWLK